MQAEQAEAEHHEGEGGAVVEAGLAGQAEAHGLGVTCALDLDVGGEHGVRRREHGAEQHGGAEREAEQGDADDGDRGDRQDHGDEGEAERRAPPAVAQRHAQLEAGGEQRDDHGDLAEPLERHGVGDRVEVDHAGGVRPEQRTGAEVQHRRAEREPLHGRAGERHHDEQRAEDEEPREERHPRNTAHVGPTARRAGGDARAVCAASVERSCGVGSQPPALKTTRMSEAIGPGRGEDDDVSDRL
jgi:hypothetical protein